MRKNEDQRRIGESTKQVVTQPLLLTIKQVGRLLNMSPSKIYTILADRYPGGIPVVRIGRSIRIRLNDLRRWVDEQ
jgi:excisionase family DNA binding protein